MIAYIKSIRNVKTVLIAIIYNKGIITRKLYKKFRGCKHTAKKTNQMSKNAANKKKKTKIILSNQLANVIL